MSLHSSFARVAIALAALVVAPMAHADPVKELAAKLEKVRQATALSADISESELTTFAREVQGLVEHRDYRSLMKACHEETFVLRTFDGRSVRPELAGDEELLGSLHACIECISDLADLQSFRLVSVSTSGEWPTALFRVGVDAWLTYFRLSFGKDREGRIRIRGLHDLVTARRTRDTTWRTLINVPIVTDLDDREKLFVEHDDVIGQLDWAFVERGSDLHEQLPSQLQAEEGASAFRLLALALRAKSKPAVASFEQARDEHARRFPDSLAPHVTTLRVAVVNHRWEDVLRAADHLDAAVGGDPFLHQYRALAQWQLGETVAAKKHAWAVMEHDIELSDAFLVLRALAIDEPDARSAQLIAQHDAALRADGIFADVEMLITTADLLRRERKYRKLLWQVPATWP